MFRAILFIAFVIAASSAFDKEECKKLKHHKVMHCCKVRPPKPEGKKDDLKECFEKRSKPPTCDMEICIAKKRGFAGDVDGTFNKKGVEADVEKIFGSNPELVEGIKKDCVNGDLSEFGPPDACDLMKLKHCVGAHALKACPEWSSEGECSGVQELVEKCVKS